MILIAELAQVAEIGAPGKYLVRPTETADLEAMAATYLAAYPPEIGAQDLAAARLGMVETFDGVYGDLWPAVSPIAVADGRVAGVVHVVRRAPWPGTPDCPFAIEVFTHPDDRRIGLGRALLTWSMARLAHKGATHLALRVLTTNDPALKLYHSLGFQPYAA
ncbi:GNAT family N-acetyltransferase [Kribbella sp. NBC_01245]|uniref:GNAT family N-acetyltransferase n=1 Tax=Kribbella sp. NBC_01245 TaxID=2903578 RepID=UPI002E2D03ED|nr:GNAT family N-acetyltransferase [Kribbella sp. NBC_01245]